MQLLQLSNFDRVQTIQCKVIIDKIIHYCEMHSHISAVDNRKKSYLQELGQRGCEKTYETGTIHIGNGVINRIKINLLTIVGFVTMDRKCSGTQYSHSGT